MPLTPEEHQVQQELAALTRIQAARKHLREQMMTRERLFSTGFCEVYEGLQDLEEQQVHRLDLTEERLLVARARALHPHAALVSDEVLAEAAKRARANGMRA